MFESSGVQRFCKNVCQLIIGSNGFHQYASRCDVVTDKVMLDIDMFGPFALQILGHPDAATVVLIDRHRFRNLLAKVSQESG